ncbi:MAG: FkbM family methyltransferase [Bacteroidia bacterium]|nr:FkbM family methyltransferase [Bacteroidia bacterium]
MKNLIYKIIELFYPSGKSIRISGITIRLPFRFRNYYQADYEIEHINFFKQRIKQNSVVLDIGAQLGLMSKVFSDLTGAGGKVFAFEPAPYTFKTLCKTIEMNMMGHTVIPVQKAVSDKKGTTQFFISKMKLDPANSLVDYKRKHDFESIDVHVTSVDDFVVDQDLAKVDFIKIDAEGAEYEVLLGAQKTLQKHRPVIHLALHPAALKSFGSSMHQIYHFIVSNNYELLFKSKVMNEQDFTSSQDFFDVELIPKHLN